MTPRSDRAGLQVADTLVRFVEDAVLPGLSIDPQTFWAGLADIYGRFIPENRALLATRDELQSQIDDWHHAHPGPPNAAEYKRFLEQIGYLVSEPPTFTISPGPIDPEVSQLAGPQLVVPVLNARFLLNAANARWGSLYDAFYGTDAIANLSDSKTYDPDRGRLVIQAAKVFLDEAIPLAVGSHFGVASYSVEGANLVPALADPSLFVGYRGPESAPTSILLRHNGLFLELDIDRASGIGRTDPAGLADVILESALTTIVDLEDSVAAVDADDKVAGYANWLGLMKGELTASFEKGGETITRSLEPDRVYRAPIGKDFVLPGRSLLFVRNVGHHMTTPAVLLPDGSEVPEGILDGVVTSTIALFDLRRQGRFTNSRAGSIYIVKPKMHGPDEAAFCDRVFDAIEDLLGLDRHTIKIGLMDEERRTSANLAACIAAVRQRIVFINTGFLDRTGDEIHTSMFAGPMVLKAQMRNSAWIKAYEIRNVQIGLACGFSGRGQIGKGMWAAPDRMADMLAQKIGHPRAGATTAWVPSPPAATLHAIHYHVVDVFESQRELATCPALGLDDLLVIPLANGLNWTPQEIQAELDNNAQGILGYVVRWVDQGIGCSKVPDIDDVGLMEDRATLRISSQHIANWLLHGVASPREVDEALGRMAQKVDAQNHGDRAYRSMVVKEDANLAYQAARALVFEGGSQPSGYTEPLLHRFRRRVKAENLQG